MMHTIWLVLLGVVLVGIVSAVLEMLALQRHPYVARIIAACAVIVAAYTHTWKRLIVATVVVFVFLGIRRDLRIRAKRKEESTQPQNVTK